MARSFWGTSDVVGEIFHSESNPDSPLEIIGVVGNTKVQSLNEAPRPALYWSLGQSAASPSGKIK